MTRPTKQRRYGPLRIHKVCCPFHRASLALLPCLFPLRLELTVIKPLTMRRAIVMIIEALPQVQHARLWAPHPLCQTSRISSIPLEQLTYAPGNKRTERELGMPACRHSHPPTFEFQLLARPLATVSWWGLRTRTTATTPVTRDSLNPL